MFSAAIFICSFLQLQLPIKSSALHPEFGFQDTVLNHGVFAPYVQPNDKILYEPYVNSDSTQLLNNLLGVRDENKMQNNLETVIEWLKKLVTTVPPPIKAPDSRFSTKDVTLAQFAKILQKNDDPFQKTDLSVINSLAYLSIIQKLLLRLDKNIVPINKGNIQSEMFWNNKVLDQITDKMLEDVNEDNEHMIIQSLRMLLRSIDKNMERLDKKNTEAKKKVNGVNLGPHSIILQKIK